MSVTSCNCLGAATPAPLLPCSGILGTYYITISLYHYREVGISLWPRVSTNQSKQARVVYLGLLYEMNQSEIKVNKAVGKHDPPKSH